VRIAEGGASAFKYHMPAWFLDELLVANPVSDFFSMADATFLFNVFGGCIRYFLLASRQKRAIDDGTHNSGSNGGIFEDYIQNNAEWFFGPQYQQVNRSIWCYAMDQIRTRIHKSTTSSVYGPNRVEILRPCPRHCGRPMGMHQTRGRTRNCGQSYEVQRGLTSLFTC